MNEIELRFHVPASAVCAVEKGVATVTAQRTRLQAIYFDTPDRRLAKAGLALRNRKSRLSGAPAGPTGASATAR